MRPNPAFLTVPFTVPLLLMLAGCAPDLRIADTPISFSEERTELTKDYIEAHYGLTPPSIRITPRIIVLHWTATNDFAASFEAFDRETLPGQRSDIEDAGQVNVSVHFLVDRKGQIHRLMPEAQMGRHVIGLNYNAIGVENVGGADGVDNLTDAQIEANIELVRYLAEKHPTIEYLIGHHEYQLMEGHPLWREQDPGYRTEKVDPGARFMRTVRAGVADLHLKGPSAILLETRE